MQRFFNHAPEPIRVNRFRKMRVKAGSSCSGGIFLRTESAESNRWEIAFAAPDGSTGHRI